MKHILHQSTEYKTLYRCLFNTGRTSQTLDQHKTKTRAQLIEFAGNVALIAETWGKRVNKRCKAPQIPKYSINQINQKTQKDRLPWQVITMARLWLCQM